VTDPAGGPRRYDPKRMKPAELEIHDAIVAVELMGPHPMLKKAVSMLQTAQGWVADYVDREGKPDG
jgi:hypothetical protein